MADPLIIDPQETGPVSASLVAPGGWKPYEPERQRDWVRTGVTVGLLAIFGGTLFWACRQSGASAGQWSQAKELLQIALPAVSGLLGSVIGFYFGSGANLDRKP